MEVEVEFQVEAASYLSFEAWQLSAKSERRTDRSEASSQRCARQEPVLVPVLVPVLDGGWDRLATNTSERH